MTGLKPAKMIYGKYFDLSMDAVHDALALAALLLATFVVTEFFLGYLMVGAIGAIMVATLAAFVFVWREADDWSAD